MRPGFELGYKDGNKYYINNHLVFNVLVYQTHGEYTAAKKKFGDSLALESLDARKLLSKASSSMSSTAANMESTDSTMEISNTGRSLKEETSDEEPYYMIVGFEVSPCSIKREAGKPVDDVVCGVDGDSHIPRQEIVEGAKIVYTYDVYWQDSKIKWASRWDAYLRMPGGKVRFSAVSHTLACWLAAAWGPA